MFNPDLKEMLKNVNSRYSLDQSYYSLVGAVAKRAREIQDEAIANEEHLDTKTVSLAIDDINSGKYVIEEPDELKQK